jgi:hypothetical protein
MHRTIVRPGSLDLDSPGRRIVVVGKLQEWTK